MTQTLGSYAQTGVPGVPYYRFFKVEDDGANDKADGFYVNNDSGANAVIAGGPAASGSLLPGNLIYVDNTSSNVANPNVQRPTNVQSAGATIATLAGLYMGLVFGDPVYLYGPVDNAWPQGLLVTLLKGRFIGLLDANSFESGGAPNALGQKIYPSSNGVSADLGKLSTVAVSTGNTSCVLGEVVGFEQFTDYGTPGVQVTSSFNNPGGTAGTVGGITIVRIAFDFPNIPIA